MNNSITVAIDPRQLLWWYLLPGDMRRPGIEWLGTVRRGPGDTGALGRIKATGRLVQVNAGATRSLDQRRAEAALADAKAALADAIARQQGAGAQGGAA